MFKNYRYIVSTLLVTFLVLLSFSTVFAAVGTNQSDYPPGSIVTVSGNNSDGAGFAAGETVHVAAAAPDSTSISCDAAVDDTGSWSCGLALAFDAPLGSYSYSATGGTSNVSQSGSFTVSAPTSPWIQSDQLDYAPSAMVTLISGGWQPNETIQLSVNDNVGQTWNISATPIADSLGAFTYQFQLPDSFVAVYSVTATGALNDVATSTFTDALNNISPTSGPEGQSFLLTVNRLGTPAWTTSTRIVFAGTTLTTTFVTSSQLKATVPASLVADEGAKAVTITSPAGGPINFTVTEGDSFTLAPQAISIATNALFNGTVATMTDNYDNTATGTFNAVINWGDNTATSAGTVTKTGVGAYTISGSHTYANQFWSTSVKTATAYPAAAIPVVNNGTVNFASAGTIVIFTGSDYQTLTYTGKTSGTSASFTGVSGWTGSGTLAVGNPITQPFSGVSVTVNEVSPGTATANTVSPLTVTDGMTYLLAAGPFTTTEGQVYTGSSPFFPGSINTGSVFPSVGNYRLLVSNGSSSAWYTLYTSGPNNYMYPNSTTGSVVFGDEGTVPYTETLYLNNGVVAATGGSNVTVNDAGLSYFSAVNTFHSVEGSSTGSIQVGKFLDSFLGDGDHSADFTVTVHWGDGASTTVPAVYAGSNAYTVSGSHTFAEEGTYAATYDVVDDGGSSLTGISTATIVVSDPAVVVAAASSITVTYGTPLSSQALATFTDPGGAEALDGTHYTATIDWGGSFGTSAGTISFSAGTFTVVGSVPYHDAGSYTPTVTVTHEASAPQTVTDSLVINPAPLTITASSATVVYGDAVPTITPIYTGFITGDNPSNSLTTLPTCSTTYTQGSSVSGSPYPTSCSGAASMNYAIAYVNGSITVNSAQLTVTANSFTKILNAPNPAFTFTITGFKNGDTASVLTTQPTCSSTAILTSPVGSYPITCSGAAADNYSFTYVNGILKVIYRFDGFLQPINDTAHTQICGSPCPASIFKGGSTVPVKFQLKDANGVVVQSASLPIWLAPVKGGSTSASVDETPYSDPASGGATYAWDGQQYHYNWSTKGFTIGFYWRIGVTLDDGQTYYVNIGLR